MIFRIYGADKSDDITASMPVSVQRKAASSGTITGMGGSSARHIKSNKSRRTAQTAKSARFSSSTHTTERYSPIHDRLDEGTVVDEWVPRDSIGILRMLTNIYHRDDVGGPMVDLFRQIAWSDYDVTGMVDDSKLQLFQDCAQAMNLEVLMPDMSAMFMVLGRETGSLLWDSRQGMFTDYIAHDPAFTKIRPMPVYGVQPLVDLMPSPGWRDFATSTDPRIVQVRSTLPNHILKEMAGSGFVPLDPINTVLLRRRALSNDSVGTSIYSRLINFLAVQNALIDSTVLTLRRSSAGFIHVKVGKDNWLASDEIIDSVGAMFMAAEEDRGGGIVATRDGIEYQREGSRASDMVKWSDEYPILTEGKMRALGISDAFLSGDSTYSNMDTARSVFIERIKAFRNTMTNQFVYRRLFATMARAHGLIKPERNSPQGRRQASMMPYHKAMQVPFNRLDIPEIKWKKSLHAVGDEGALAILDHMKEVGLPVTKRHYAAAGGFDLDKALEMTDEDTEITKRMEEWKDANAPPEGEEGEGGFGGFASVSRDINERVRYLPTPIRTAVVSGRKRGFGKLAKEGLRSIPWDSANRFVGLKRAKARMAMRRVLPIIEKGTRKRPASPKVVIQAANLDTVKERSAFRYILARLGALPGYYMSENAQRRICKHYMENVPVKKANREIELLMKLCFAERVSKAPAPARKGFKAAGTTNRRPEGSERLTGMPNGPGDHQLISGLTD